MLYKKYAIEIVKTIFINEFSRINSECDMLDSLKIRIDNNIKNINNIYYLNEHGELREYSTDFYSYKEAYDIMNKYYYQGFFNNNTPIISIKIVEIFNDIIPPIKILRKLKLENILSDE